MATPTSNSERQHFAEYWLPEMRANGVNVSFVAICPEDPVQSEIGLRDTLLLVERIYDLAAEQADDVAVCLTGADIDAAKKAGKIALVIALEGVHEIGQNPRLIRTMARVGMRVLSMAYWGRIFLADGRRLDDTPSGSHLTGQAVDVFKEMERLGIVLDVSHLGISGIEDILELATRPFLATHSACRKIVDARGDLGDELTGRIASLGSVICVPAVIPHFADAMSSAAERTVDQIEQTAAVAGIDHVGIGPNFIEDYHPRALGERAPGSGLTGNTDLHEDDPRADACEAYLPKIVAALVRRGFSEDDIKKLLGGNIMRVLREVMGISLD